MKMYWIKKKNAFISEKNLYNNNNLIVFLRFENPLAQLYTTNNNIINITDCIVEITKEKSIRFIKLNYNKSVFILLSVYNQYYIV